MALTLKGGMPSVGKSAGGGGGERGDDRVPLEAARAVQLLRRVLDELVVQPGGTGAAMLVRAELVEAEAAAAAATVMGAAAAAVTEAAASGKRTCLHCQ